MQVMVAMGPVFALFILGGGELILIAAVILILFWAKNLPEIHERMRNGFSEFRRASRNLQSDIDEEAQDAGKSLGGIYGKPAAEALTPGNQVAELYDPAAFQKSEKRSTFLIRLWRRVRAFFFRCLGRKV